MTSNRQMSDRKSRGTAKPKGISRWFMRKMNARTSSRIRRGLGTNMGMNQLILHTVGRRSGEPRQSPITWFADGDARLIVASGAFGFDQQAHPEWYLNLMAHPGDASIELSTNETVPVAPHLLAGADRDRAWQLIVAAQPRYEKFQRKTTREYPLIRLTPRD
ncbi:nitroreductase family deazaflavin-dependent oxidoreductase [Nocardia sp. NPDC088792]|uniref:nitroreductase family deazaflavin-dependent oxidoreductase n=1 Tax=Nocardia sp. NPDC088792 TaxID=3364332 RepID=UPI003815FEEE